MGWVFLRVKSAEGRRAPENAAITKEEYEEDRRRILQRINAYMCDRLTEEEKRV